MAMDEASYAGRDRGLGIERRKEALLREGRPAGWVSPPLAGAGHTSSMSLRGLCIPAILQAC